MARGSSVFSEKRNICKGMEKTMVGQCETRELILFKILLFQVLWTLLMGIALSESPTVRRLSSCWGPERLRTRAEANCSSGPQAPTGKQRHVGGAIPPLSNDLAIGKTGV